MARQSFDLDQILGIDSELNQIHDLDLLLERVLSEARRVANADAGSIYIKEGDSLYIRYSQNDTLQAMLPTGQKLMYSIFTIGVNEETIAGYAAMTKKIVNIPDAYAIGAGSPYSYNTSFDVVTGYKTTSILSVPLVTSDGKLLGVIQVINARGEDNEKVQAFSQRDEQLVQHFATNAAIALQRARMSRAIMLRMIRMSELRDPKETGPHVNRVAGYAAEIYDRWAYRHGIDSREADHFKDLLRFSAMLHDVGKVAISDLILKKPARFTDEEYRIMQAHTSHGAKLFDDPASEYDELAAEVALCHHQNWDGSGYPTRAEMADLALIPIPPGDSPGLKGEEIPLGGRITALADVYDALVSRRVYKEGWETSKAVEEISKLSGSKFDPELVEIFMEILPNITQIRERYPEQAE